MFKHTILVAAVAGMVLALAGTAHAAAYYYDNNSDTAGFGTAGGSWLAPTPGPTPGWTTSTTGVTIPGSYTTTTSDTLNFGNGATGLGAGTITVGTVDAGNMTFASGSGAIVLSGGTITLAAAETLLVSNISDTISSELAGAGTSLTVGGTGTLVLNGANTFTGKVILGNNNDGLKVQINTIKNVGGGASSLGAPTTEANGVIQIGNTSKNSTLEFVGATAAASTDRMVKIGRDGTGSGGAIILNNNADPTYTLTFSNSAFNVVANMGSSGGGRALTLGGSNTGNNTIAGAIVDNKGTGTGWPIALIKNDAGTWILAGANTYTRSTAINGGTLVVNGSLAAASAVTVNSGGTLGGTGAIGGAVNVLTGGTLAPGGSIGTLTLGNALTLAGDALFEIDGMNPGDYDRVIGVTDLTYGGTLTIQTASLMGPFDLDLFDFTTRIGTATFTAITDAGGNYAPTDLTMNYSTGVLSGVPEPATLALLALGGLGLILSRKRK